jgi:hypothetical protein
VGKLYFIYESNDGAILASFEYEAKIFGSDAKVICYIVLSDRLGDMLVNIFFGSVNVSLFTRRILRLGRIAGNINLAY